MVQWKLHVCMCNDERLLHIMQNPFIHGSLFAPVRPLHHKKKRTHLHLLFEWYSYICMVHFYVYLYVENQWRSSQNKSRNYTDGQTCNAIRNCTVCWTLIDFSHSMKQYIAFKIECNSNEIFHSSFRICNVTKKF